MTGPAGLADTAFRVADHLRSQEPWEVFAERSRRYEIHFAGSAVQMVRGPLTIEGYALRLLRFKDGITQIGTQASSDLSDDGIRTAQSDAESLVSRSKFPAKRVELPGPVDLASQNVEVCDRKLWQQPLESIQGYFDDLVAPFATMKDAVPSFGSIRATLTETSIANSAGLRVAFPATLVELEVAVKAFGGPEGVSPGEYWVNDRFRRLEPEGLDSQVKEWVGFARDARRAKLPPTGDLPVVLPSSVLVGILPPVLGRRFTGVARLQEQAPAVGGQIGKGDLTIADDGRVPWAVGSGPVDDEGSPHRRLELLAQGKVAQLLYNVGFAGAFDLASTGNAVRVVALGLKDWRRFPYGSLPGSTTLVVLPGDGGTDHELVEQVEDGVWVQQLGEAFPNPLTGAFGGELRMGYRIRHGKLAEPVRAGTVGGLVMAPPGEHSLLADVVTVGSTPTLSDGVYSPAILVRPLTLAGG